MMTHILGYVIAILAAAVVAPVIGALLFVVTAPVIGPFRPLGRTTFIYNFVLATASMSSALLLFLWIAKQITAGPALLMLAIPWLGVLLNDYARIDAARERRFLSGVGEFLARQVDDLDFRGVVWGEHGYLCGDIVAFALAAYSMRASPLY